MAHREIAARWLQETWRKGKPYYIAAGAGGLVLAAYALRRSKSWRQDGRPSSPVEGESVYPPCQYDFTKAKRDSALLIKEIQEKSMSPGVTVAVGVNGQIVWTEGFGHADVENEVPCTPQSVMRIASISKPITMLLLAHLWDAGLVDLDTPVQKYVPLFPEKTVDGEPVTVTTRMLLHHIAGIRHYLPKPEETQSAILIKSAGDGSAGTATTSTNIKDSGRIKDDEMKQPEYFIKRHYDSVGEAIELFANDPLRHKPGSKFLYSTHGFTLVSAVIEGASGRPFLSLLDDMLFQLGLPHIQAEHMDRLIPHRSRYYQLDDDGKLRNAPYVDNSYKWAGGGLLATAKDIAQFGVRVLTSYFGKPLQQCDHSANPQPCRQCTPYVKGDTIAEMWRVHPVTRKEAKDKKSLASGYGMAWIVRPKPTDSVHGVASFSHTGGAVGASSALVIIPPPGKKKPNSVVVAIICNMESVDLEATARSIGEVFLQESTVQDQQRKKKKTGNKAGGEVSKL